MDRLGGRWSPILLAVLCAQSRAEIREATAAHAAFQYAITVRAAPAQVYVALIDVPHWWSSKHTYSGDAANLRLDARAGGCWCEQLPGGGSVQHMTVTAARPGTQLRLAGALGPLQDGDLTGNMTWTLEPTKDGGTALTMSYLIDGYFPGGLDQLSGTVDQVLTEQVGRLRRFIETGRADAAVAK